MLLWSLIFCPGVHRLRMRPLQLIFSVTWCIYFWLPFPLDSSSIFSLQHKKRVFGTFTNCFQCQVSSSRTAPISIQISVLQCLKGHWLFKVACMDRGFKVDPQKPRLCAWNRAFLWWNDKEGVQVTQIGGIDFNFVNFNISNSSLFSITTWCKAHLTWLPA